MLSKIIRKASVALVVSTALLVASQGPALAYESDLHVFSIDDVQGGFDGSTFGTTGATQDLSIICDLGTTACPVDNQPFLDKSGVTLYPVDSEFGYYIVDFLGAQGKSRDGDYLEGFVGNIMDGTDVIGIQVSNAATEKYKVKPPLGTWCQGLGGTSVKCETEHYTVLEHVLSCYETIPYSFADPVTGDQAILSTPPAPDGSFLEYYCDNAPLDDNTLILVNGLPDVRLTNAEPCESGDPKLGTELPEGCQMFPNDKTDMQNNIALGTDYSVQLKDDGKPLYGWGATHKRPNDIRMYARLNLPEEWKAPEANFDIIKAELVINHWITNNPNDQLRPEDLENEAATGRKPSYRIDPADSASPDPTATVWKSTIPCYEGDGDLIDTEEGDIDPTFIGIGTYLKNTPFALPLPDPINNPVGNEPAAPPYAFSSDLPGAFTNAFYTTINRDPFEWSYVNTVDANGGVYNFEGYAFPLSIEDMAAGGLELVSGPRWRLKPNKFGQDLPGLEIPLIECSAPPFKSDNIKYVVGTPVTTVINLLDWDEEANGPSPLKTSQGWVDVFANEFVTVAGETNGVPYTTNGLPMTDDFDLAVYIKGDRKSTAVYNAQLIIDYGDDQPPASYDLAMSLSAPAEVIAEEASLITATVTNLGPGNLAEVATVTVTGITNRGTVIELDPATATVSELPDGDAEASTFTFTVQPDKSSKIVWTATVTVASGEDTNPANDTATATTKVRK